ncbi:UNKNOWN [Stylonychia lemnae]|uniref:Mannosyltransferase n=1 Tax=Stylonychia lemnae TaxID=5949 RepID=A0A078B3J9_STYLE|nr:UNKNOWN [Stylonychia lemnae]|eukprot:CDW89024.1 UNKNOWN [Stylonychia lemnae]
MHSILVLAGDIYMFKLAFKLFNKEAATISLLLYISCYSVTTIAVRTFTNSIEGFLLLITLYYFYEIKVEFDRNVKIFAILMAISFSIRCTSAACWIIPIMHKIYIQPESLNILLKAAAFISKTCGLTQLYVSYRNILHDQLYDQRDKNEQAISNNDKYDTDSDDNGINCSSQGKQILFSNTWIDFHNHGQFTQ